MINLNKEHNLYNSSKTGRSVGFGIFWSCGSQFALVKAKNIYWKFNNSLNIVVSVAVKCDVVILCSFQIICNTFFRVNGTFS